MQARVSVNATHEKKGVFENSHRILLNLLQLYTYPDAAVLYHFLKENYLSVPIDLVRFYFWRRSWVDGATLMLKKTVKNYQGPVVLRNLSMWFFGAVLEYRGKRNSNIGKKKEY